MRRTTSAADLQRAAQKKKVIVLAVLLGVLVLLWLVNVLKSRPQPAVGSPASTSTITTVASVSDPVVTTARQPRIEVQIEWPAVTTRDPFEFDDREYEKQEVQASDLNRVFELQGTILGNDPRALVNGNGYRIGDSIDGAVITKIGHGQVTLEIDGVEVVVGKK